MSELEKLEERILELSAEDQAKLRSWFIEQDQRQWDKQIEADSQAGKLDHLIAEARAEYRSGKAKEL